jgi:hypothetical protein
MQVPVLKGEELTGVGDEEPLLDSPEECAAALRTEAKDDVTPILADYLDACLRILLDAADARYRDVRSFCIVRIILSPWLPAVAANHLHR